MLRFLLPLALVLTVPVFAQTTQGDGHAGMTGMNQMAEDMQVELTGDPDIDFLRMMIPHHQDALDMARDVLENGQDAEVRALAEEIIAAQDQEIARMQEMLSARGY